MSEAFRASSHTDCELQASKCSRNRFLAKAAECASSEPAQEARGCDRANATSWFVERRQLGER